MAAARGEMRGLRPAVVLLGDSLTQQGSLWETGGWALRLAAWYGIKADVLNRGQSGYTTRMVRQLLQERQEAWMAPDSLQEVGVVVLFLGANDAAVDGEQFVPVAEYKANLLAIVHRIRSTHPCASFVLVAPPAVDDEHWHQSRQAKHRFFNPTASEEEVAQVALDRNHASTRAYADAALEAAAACSAVGVDFYATMVAAGNAKPAGSAKEAQLKRSGAAPPYAFLLSDGLHLSAAGNELLASCIEAAIAQADADMTPDGLQEDFLAWAAMRKEQTAGGK